MNKEVVLFVEALAALFIAASASILLGYVTAKGSLAAPVGPSKLPFLIAGTALALIVLLVALSVLRR